MPSAPAALRTRRPQAPTTTSSTSTRPARPLSDAQQHAWRRLTEVVVKLPAALERQLQSDAGMSHFEYRILAILREAPDGMLATSSIAVQVHASLSRVSHAITRLERRGWIERRRCARDARVAVAVLTPVGLERVVGAASAHLATVRRLVFDAIGDSDAVELARLCEVIVHQLTVGAR
jgi:DNA-binding MarR family transcriptional regulator